MPRQFKLSEKQEFTYVEKITQRASTTFSFKQKFPTFFWKTDFKKQKFLNSFYKYFSNL